MQIDNKTLRWIYDRTSGYCHICSKKLSLSNYGRSGEKGTWEIEHSVPRAKGGTDHLNNLYPACTTCNRSKGTATTVTARGWHGRQRAPLSKEKREEAMLLNTLLGIALGGLGGALLGRGLWLLGGIIGGAFGHSVDPDN